MVDAGANSLICTCQPAGEDVPLQVIWECLGDDGGNRWCGSALRFRNIRRCQHQHRLTVRRMDQPASMSCEGSRPLDVPVDLRVVHGVACFLLGLLAVHAGGPEVSLDSGDDW